MFNATAGRVIEFREYSHPSLKTFYSEHRGIYF